MGRSISSNGALGFGTCTTRMVDMKASYTQRDYEWEWAGRGQQMTRNRAEHTANRDKESIAETRPRYDRLRG